MVGTAVSVGGVVGVAPDRDLGVGAVSFVGVAQAVAKMVTMIRAGSMGMIACRLNRRGGGGLFPHDINHSFLIITFQQRPSLYAWGSWPVTRPLFLVIEISE